MSDKSNTTYEMTSNVVRNRVCLKWIIKNFSLYDSCENDHQVHSCVFPSADASWKFCIYPKCNGKVMIWLKQADPKCQLKKVSCKASLQNENGVHCFANEGRHDISQWATILTIESDVLQKGKRKELLPNDTLTIFCELTYGIITKHSSVVQTEQKEKETISPDACTNKLATDFKRIFDDQKYCDVVLLSSDSEKFPVHKAILEARSSVFSAMFHNDMLETRQGEVCIKDIDGVILKQLLHYIYTAEVNETFERDVSKLYVAADKYDIDSLKQKCKHHILDNMSVDNVCDAIVLADMFNDNELKELAIHILNKNASKIITSEPWKEFLKEHPSLAAETLQAIVLQNKI